ncbi:MAG: hypothetical protein FWC68_01115 [Oscillospiraceae bacterium]|nr:hypothetical protein [Oscillospiraceae bacterium]
MDRNMQKKEKNKQAKREAFDSTTVTNETMNSEKCNQVSNKSRRKRINPLVKFVMACITLAIVTLMMTTEPTIETTPEVERALTYQYSTTLNIGAILLSEDEPMDPQDRTIVHENNSEEARIWIWDFAAEDGDFVQILVNGEPIGDAFMIRHRPVELMVPTVGELQVKGVRDGGRWNYLRNPL